LSGEDVSPISTATLSVTQLFDDVLRNLKKLQRSANSSLHVPTDIEEMIEEWSSIDLEAFSPEDFERLSKDARGIDEFVHEALAEIVANRRRPTAAHERTAELSTRILQSVKEIENADAPSLRNAIQATREEARQRKRPDRPGTLATDEPPVRRQGGREDDDLEMARPHLGTTHREGQAMPNSAIAPDPRIVFVVHGRNLDARNGMFSFLRALGLRPLDWNQAVKLTGEGSPYIGQVLDHAFAEAQAVVVLLTPDEIAYLRKEYASREDDPELNPASQARPNVLFEAGMAFGRHPKRTILVELGSVRPFSDVVGRHALRMSNSAEMRAALADRLRIAGCEIDTGTDWLTAGDLRPPPPPGGNLPLGRRLPVDKPPGIRLDARYVNRGKGNGRLQITNYSSFEIYLGFEIPEEAGPSFHVHAELPVRKLPPGKTVSFPAIQFIGQGADHFEINITGRTPDGDSVMVPAFISLVG